MSNVCVVGLQWGDEGKGKIVDVLTQECDVVVRFQGGSNAGHTVVVRGEKYVLHQVPSGILHAGRLCVIANGVALDPERLIVEMDGLCARGVEIDDNLRISDRAHVVFPYHKVLDSLDVSLGHGQKIGTTGRGIGPCYADKMGRTGIRMVELYRPDHFRERLRVNVEEKNRKLASLKDGRSLDWREIYEVYVQYAERLKPYVCDTVALLNGLHAEGKRILFEGAQGALLDVDLGTYPYITCSNASACGAAAGAGLPPKAVGRVVGVTKAYTTRVGEGPFPTELNDDVGESMREKGGEYGATTGRPRRCGWFDAVAVRHSATVNGVDSIVITKLDVLGGRPEVKISTGYRFNGETVSHFPADAFILERCDPVYEVLPGWSEDIGNCREFAELPRKAQEYVRRLEQAIGLHVDTISVGQDRTQTIKK